MVFSSNNFTFNNIYSRDMNIHLVSEDSGILNDFGIPFNIESEDETINTILEIAKESSIKTNEKVVKTRKNPQKSLTNGGKYYIIRTMKYAPRLYF